MDDAPLTIDAAIIGVQRGGTSSLAAALDEHPDVCLAEGKEAHLFDLAEVQDHGPDPAALDALFATRQAGSVLLDATPSYMYIPGSLEALRRHNPALRVIVVMRDPAERARSHHALQVARGWEELDFAEGLRAEDQRLAEDPDPMRLLSATRVFSYRTRGRYHRQVARVLEHFPDALFLRFDDLVARPGPTVALALAHLGLEPVDQTDALPKLNGHRGSEHSWRETMLRLELRRDTRATERLLGWPSGTINRARAPRT